ncbi:hypothetical protein JGS22_017860 [Streptomyces sp. P38-E01]|uniref:Outer membrane channel protein CpnT-like N-terminal domain-containing protein n=1 Tax=Streptomyces tardus TaxID=2780544 RepID=A0A949JQK2_9ACTN|nr:hypothetical protein [Streptomyces tardus]MBU7599431.1 hypothetical protein [Streptomyces tardus]
MMMLDPKLEWVLEMLGYRWPTGDEDKLRSCAMVWRNFAASVDEIQVQGVHAAGNVLSQNSGDAIEGFGESWKKFSGNGSGYLDDAKRGAELIAATLDAAAMIVTMLKIAVIIQLIALAVQLAAAAAAAPFTFGASSIAGAAATQLARVTVRRLLTEAAQVMLQAVLQAAKEPFVTALQKMTTDLVAQTVNQKFGAQDGYDAGRTAQAGKEGFKEGVDNAGTALGEGLRDGAGSRAGRGARGGLESAADRSGGDDGTGGSDNGGSDNGSTRQGSSDDGGTSGDSSGNAGSGNSGTGATSGTGSTPGTGTGTGTRDGGGEGGRSGAPSTGGNSPGASAPNSPASDGTSPSDSARPGSRSDSSDAAANYPRPADTSHQPYRDNPFDAPRHPADPMCPPRRPAAPSSHPIPVSRHRVPYPAERRHRHRERTPARSTPLPGRRVRASPRARAVHVRTFRLRSGHPTRPRHSPLRPPRRRPPHNPPPATPVRPPATRAGPRRPAAPPHRTPPDRRARTVRRPYSTRTRPHLTPDRAGTRTARASTSRARHRPSRRRRIRRRTVRWGGPSPGSTWPRPPGRTSN